jgi:hypothetical protein
MGAQPVRLLSHGIGSDEGYTAPRWVLVGMARNELHPMLGGCDNGVVMVQWEERDAATDALWREN